MSKSSYNINNKHINHIIMLQNIENTSNHNNHIIKRSIQLNYDQSF
uniref:Uncharacterized protein n=1 Tax=Rhizophora mucronata TaxID=61149 RepID=A0A2P2IHL3_RHIMU